MPTNYRPEISVSIQKTKAHTSYSQTAKRLFELSLGNPVAIAVGQFIPKIPNVHNVCYLTFSVDLIRCGSDRLLVQWVWGSSR